MNRLGMGGFAHGLGLTGEAQPIAATLLQALVKAMLDHGIVPLLEIGARPIRQRGGLEEVVGVVLKRANP